MRHRKKGRKLNRTWSHRKAMMRNMVTTALTMRRYGDLGNCLRVGGTHATVPRMAMWRFARYLQRTLPDHVELMEISRGWAENMVAYFEGASLTADGRSIGSTAQTRVHGSGAAEEREDSG